jgi:hypothetical protein
MISEPPPYPRIPHLSSPPEMTGNDLVLSSEDAERFLHEPVVVEEKLDGANVMLWLAPDEPIVHAAGRSGPGGMDRAGQLGRLQAWATERSDGLGTLLARGTVLYAEWLYLTHTVHYGRLPDLLVGTDLYTPEAGFRSADERDRQLQQVDLATPPRLFEGVLGDATGLETLFGRSAFGDEPAEGLVLRRERRGRLLARAKVLRPGFMRVDDVRWREGPGLNTVDAGGRESEPAITRWLPTGGGYDRGSGSRRS